MAEQDVVVLEQTLHPEKKLTGMRTNKLVECHRLWTRDHMHWSITTRLERERERERLPLPLLLLLLQLTVI